MIEKTMLSIAMIALAVVLSFFVKNLIILITIWAIFGIAIFFLFADRDKEPEKMRKPDPQN